MCVQYIPTNLRFKFEKKGTQKTIVFVVYSTSPRNTNIHRQLLVYIRELLFCSMFLSEPIHSYKRTNFSVLVSTKTNLRRHRGKVSVHKVFLIFFSFNCDAFNFFLNGPPSALLRKLIENLFLRAVKTENELNEDWTKNFFFFVTPQRQLLIPYWKWDVFKIQRTLTQKKKWIAISYN